MKFILRLLLIAIILQGCVSSGTYMKRGDYNTALRKSIEKLRKNKKNEKEIVVLEQSFEKANQVDKERINFIQKEGSPERFDEVFDRYCDLKERQEFVKTILPLQVPSSKRNVQFAFYNYDDDIIASKQKAAEYFYAHAVKLLDKQDRMSARQAYNDLIRVKQYYTDYRDTEDLLKKAKFLGTNNIIFKMENKTGVPLPPGFEDDLVKISLSDLNNRWLNYDTKETKDLYYDYTILVNMKNIMVSPEGLKEVHFEETKQVQDGYTYVLDSRGNVKKDSLGNDIKIPKYITIGCKVVETQRTKKAMIAGTLDYINNRTGQLIKTDPIAAETFFENFSAVAFGDLNALKPETKKKLNNPPAPFPNDFAMIMEAGSTMKNMVKNIIYTNKNILQ